MVRIPNIKIPSVRVGGIDPTSDIGTGGATPAPPTPTPIIYLTQWKIVGNSEVHGQEIWSCGEYNATDGKWHILVQPLGGSIADIALDEPLRKVNDVADTIEFPSDTEGKALVTRNVDSNTVSAYNDADGNQIATTLPDGTILHIQNLYDYTQTTKINVSFNDVSQRSAEVKIIQTAAASYCGFSTPLQSGNYYSSCLFKNEDAKPNIIYSNSGNSSTVSSSDYQKISLLESNVTTFRFSALNNPTGVWEVDDVFFVKDINIFDIDAMFADCTDLKPANTSDFETLFPNLGCIDKTDTAIDVIVKDGKLYKYVETEGKALVTRKLFYDSLTSCTTWYVSSYSHCALGGSWGNILKQDALDAKANMLIEGFSTTDFISLRDNNPSYGCACSSSSHIALYDGSFIPESGTTPTQAFYDYIADKHFIAELATPTTSLVDAPQIAEANSYSMVISQGAKCVEWSSFETNSE